MLRQSLYWRSVARRKLPTGRASRTPNRGATPRQALGRRWASLALSVGRPSLLQWYRASAADQGVRPTMGLQNLSSYLLDTTRVARTARAPARETGCEVGQTRLVSGAYGRRLQYTVARREHAVRAGARPPFGAYGPRGQYTVPRRARHPVSGAPVPRRKRTARDRGTGPAAAAHGLE